jgi:thiol-disulfide isomerase/thioredoxin
MTAKLYAAMFFAIAPVGFAPISLAQSQNGSATLAGLWDATLKTNTAEIPFKFELSGSGPNVAGSFFNGDDKFTSTSGTFENGALALNWDYYGSKLEATLKDGILEGTYSGAGRRRTASAFRAHRASTVTESNSSAPTIAGVWEIPARSSKGESTWRFIVQQSGSQVSAAVLRIDGDTGAFTGSYQGDKFLLSHFDGARSGLMEIKLQADGTLDVLDEGNKVVAIRPAEARAKGLPEPNDPAHHTSVKDPKDGFPFSFPDLSGKVVSNADARFKNKVVLVNITGSWCPNCHDEAPFLASLYKKYKDQGLEIVALSFEEAEQLKNPVRLKAFIKKYGIDYTVLLGGEPGDANSKLTEAVNWNSWPTTFFVGRDGRVRGAHAGFPSNGSGELYRQAKEEFTAQVEHLLGE